MRAVIFDLDGVLVRTDQAHDKAWRALAVRLGIPFDGRAAARLRGVSRMEALDIVLEGCGRSFTPAEKEALAAEKNERYRALIAEMTPADVAPDTTVTLKALRERGLLANSAMVCNCGLPDEAVFPALTDYDPAQDAGYFATILVKE